MIVITRQNPRFFELMASYGYDNSPKSLKNATFGNLVDVYLPKVDNLATLGKIVNDNSPKSQFF